METIIKNVTALENGGYQAEINGRTWVVQPTSRRMALLREWEAEGNALPAYEPPAEPDPLTLERQQMQAWKRAFRQALRLFPHPTAGNQFAGIELAISSGQAPDGMAEAWDEVAQFQRMHPDTIAFGSALGFAPEQLDALFRVAMQIEAGTPVDEIDIPT